MSQYSLDLIVTFFLKFFKILPDPSLTSHNRLLPHFLEIVKLLQGVLSCRLVPRLVAQVLQVSSISVGWLIA